MHFSSNCPLQIWTSKTCNKDISKTITAIYSSLRFFQLIEVKRLPGEKDGGEILLIDKLRVGGTVPGVGGGGERGYSDIFTHT